MAAIIQKKITATERKALDKLLDEDFSILRNDLQRMAEEARQNGRKAIDQEVKARTTRARKVEDKIRDLVRSAEDEGFRVVDSSGRYGDGNKILFRVEDTERAKAVEACEKAVGQELVAAYTLLARKQHQARRDMLVATLSDEAVSILGTVPSAESVMLEVAVAQKQASLTA